ncbi:hypothetical protein LEP1GSC050_2915 [Leptospira broomii serovar Hurstbridge str. 5399]|uniref:Uncharacterized protein n=1 Tax=Leptospira broomii serovar Hurstbridge str. 5399 TaxID=1049789 RepID=T0F9S5_9LEPT|nr:hypothetical protein LEP1GSC050_2915 [Leptospira broomii serovar Hurstbridge str. 5399]
MILLTFMNLKPLGELFIFLILVIAYIHKTYSTFQMILKNQKK